MNKIIEVRFGSHLYGTNTPESDLDVKGIYLPTAREIVLNRARRNISQSRPKQEFERNTKDDIDQEFFSLGEFLKLLAEGQTVALDILFSDAEAIRFKGPEYHLFQHIYDNRFKLISKNVMAFIGYAHKQAAKYGIKGSRVRAVKDTIEFFSAFPDETLLRDIKPALDAFVAKGDEFIKFTDILNPQDTSITYLEVVNRKFQLTNSVKYVKAVLQKIYNEYGHRALQAEKNEGIDWKALSHAVRVNFEGQELLSTGFITFPRPERELLLDIKLGKIGYNRVADLIEIGLKQLEELQRTSGLRGEPDFEWADNFLYEVYSGIIKA
jgi:hypothetical protein